MIVTRTARLAIEHTGTFGLRPDLSRGIRWAWTIIQTLNGWRMRSRPGRNGSRIMAVFAVERALRGVIWLFDLDFRLLQGVD